MTVSSIQRWAQALAALALATLSLTAAAQVPTAPAPGVRVSTPQVQAEAVVHAPEGLQPGRPAWLGLRLQHQRGWHTYWKNPGDSGLPTRLAWTLPPGWNVGEIQWPAPQGLPLGPLMNQGYEGEVLLLMPLTVAAPVPAEVTLRLRADWLVCHDVCIPEGGDFALTVNTAQGHSRHADAVQRTQARWPDARSGATARAQVKGDALELTIDGLPPSWRGQTLNAFVAEAQLVQHATPVQGRWLDGGSSAAAWSGRLALSPERQASPTTVGVVLVPVGAAATPAAIEVQAPVSGPWPALAAPPSLPPPVEPAQGPAGAEDGTTASSWATWGAALVAALLGGMLLNLMPCVFPVLSLKVFGFASQAHDRRALAWGGLAYTVGVVASFVALAGLLLGLRATGEQLGWGFQLQSPVMVVALAGLFALMAMNLMGLFEFGSVLPSRWATARAPHPLLDHALTGVLAVLVASPCTGPFMGASLGAAITLPTPQALSVFAALGLGLALPYLVLCLVPRWAERLPRPGPWMNTFKQVMALPMVATVLWLGWVLGHQVGVDGLTALWAWLAVLALAASAWRPQAAAPGAGRRRALGALALLAASVVAWPLMTRPPEAPTAVAGGALPTADGRWHPWSAEQVQALQAQGTPVFVDFTAAWCVTCQVNKSTSLRRTEVLQAAQAQGVVLMVADWTRQDPIISQALNRLGRTGVPVYAMHRPGQAAPEVLPELLTPERVIQAFSGR